jgi:hypothetical protein
LPGELIEAHGTSELALPATARFRIQDFWKKPKALNGFCFSVPQFCSRSTIFGYARVWTAAQDLDNQLAQLRAASRSSPRTSSARRSGGATLTENRCDP